MSFFNFRDPSDSPKRPSSATSPPAVVPFCTSPSQLQETLDYDGTFSNTMGLRSPVGPMRGRSVKEFEEQLSNLKKENFNLKLRIYFLEEKMGTNFTLDKDNIVKNYIKLQVDYANLKKEMEEKQELLCQAVKAMELEDEEHKKFVADKEDQLTLCQQEIEDLRIQLQDIKYDSEGASLKSDTTGYCSSKTANSGTNELQQKIKILEQELRLEKENNASLQFIIGQTETIKTRRDNMEKEIQAKDDIIKNLRDENETLSTKITNNILQIQEFQGQFDNISKANQTLQKKLLMEAKKCEEMASQYSELKKKYSGVKIDLEREYKKSERTKSVNDTKVLELEEENDKMKSKLRELQMKLDAALTEIRKNQNLAVSKSPNLKPNKSNTDIPCVSVQDPTTPTGITQENPLYVQITSSGSLKASASSTSLSPSVSTPEHHNLDIEDLLDNYSDDKIISAFKSLKQDYQIQRQKIFKLKTEQVKACEIIKNMIDSRNKSNEEISRYQLQIKNLEKELESVVSKPTSDGDVPHPLRERVARTNNEKSKEGSKVEDMEVAELHKALTVELEAKIEILEATLKEKDIHMQKIREHSDELLVSLKEKENVIEELELELLSNNPEAKIDKSSQEKRDTASEKRTSFYLQEIAEKDKEIEKLNTELKKCSCYLQEIVNKELWEKNKEIEKLHNRQMNSSEILKLKKDLTGKEHQIKVLTEKISEIGLDLNINCDAEFKDPTSPSKIQHIRTLQDELVTCKEERNYFKDKLTELENANYPEVIDKLRAQTESLKIDLEKSEKLKNESNKVCTLLNRRLEELTIFLDSLLKQKSLLGYIGMQKERKLREIINSYLDLSKSFNTSFIFNPDESLVQLTNISSILNGSAFKDLSLMEPHNVEDNSEMLKIIPDDISLTYQSYLYKQNKKSEPNNEEVISALRNQIVNLKSELHLRDNELNRLNTGSKLSDTDEDQKDKNFSGYVKELSKYVTPTKSNTTSTTLKYQSDCHSESEGWSEPDRTVSRARIGLNQTLQNNLLVKSGGISESTEDDSSCHITPKMKLFYDKQQISELQQQVSKLQIECDEKSEQLKSMVTKELYDQVKSSLLECESRLIKTESLKTEAENKLDILKKQVDELIKVKEELDQKFVKKDKEVQNLMNLLEVAKTEKLKLTAELEQAVEKAKDDLREYQNRENQYKHLEIELKKEVEALEIKRTKEHEQFQEFEKKSSRMIEEMKEDFSQTYIKRIKEVEDEYFRNYIKKSDAEQKQEEIDKMMVSYELAIDMYKKEEQKMNQKLLNAQEKINSLRNELDSMTLQYSESVLEKTKLANQKTSLEQEISRYSARDMELKQQLVEINSELKSVSQKYQSQITSLQKENSELQLKISVLESTKAELHNKFVRTHRIELSATVPNLSTVVESYEHRAGLYRQFSDPCYGSEGNLEECGRYNLNTSFSTSRQPVDTDRQEANASPDLGIESDQGRFSSLETHHNNINRPLLPAIAVTESLNNLLDGENTDEQQIQTLTNENNYLKRQLCKMRRALETTADQLHLANQRKKQVEKTICKQIHKTSQVLRQAKANLDSGSESDAFKSVG